MKKTVKITAICNQKGGTAKSTTTVNLGIGLAREGKRVLLVDSDPKCRIRHFGSYAEKIVMPKNKGSLHMTKTSRAYLGITSNVATRNIVSQVALV